MKNLKEENLNLKNEIRLLKKIIENDYIEQNFFGVTNYFKKNEMILEIKSRLYKDYKYDLTEMCNKLNSVTLRGYIMFIISQIIMICLYLLTK